MPKEGFDERGEPGAPDVADGEDTVRIVEAIRRRAAARTEMDRAVRRVMTAIAPCANGENARRKRPSVEIGRWKRERSGQAPCSP